MRSSTRGSFDPSSRRPPTGIGCSPLLSRASPRRQLPRSDAAAARARVGVLAGPASSCKSHRVFFRLVLTTRGSVRSSHVFPAFLDTEKLPRSVLHTVSLWVLARKKTHGFERRIESSRKRKTSIQFVAFAYSILSSSVGGNYARFSERERKKMFGVGRELMEYCHQ